MKATKINFVNLMSIMMADEQNKMYFKGHLINLLNSIFYDKDKMKKESASCFEFIKYYNEKMKNKFLKYLQDVNQLKEKVKRNKEEVEENCEKLKQEFYDKFIIIENYEKQNIDISEIKCDNCKEKNKSNTYNNEMYICNECNMNLCPLCKSIHDKSHIIINYDNKNYICKEHNKTFVKYCEDCKKDLCLSCIKGHKNHKIISYGDELIDMKDLRKKMKVLEEDINKFKMNIV